MPLQDHAVAASVATGARSRYFDTNARAAFRRDGFASVTRPVATAAALDEAERALRSQLERSLRDNTYRDLASGEPLAPQIHEIVHATRRDPQLRHGDVCRALRSLASELLDVDRVRLHFDHAILKPPHNGAATAFHQDIAFDPATDGPMATVWLSFCDVDETAGCMQYLAGSHELGVLKHHRSGHAGMATDVEGLGEPIACPLPRGGVSIHGTRTVHASGPNRSDQSRLAWILKFVPEDRAPWRSAVSDRYRRLKYASEYR